MEMETKTSKAAEIVNALGAAHIEAFLVDDVDPDNPETSRVRAAVEPSGEANALHLAHAIDPEARVLPTR